MGLRKWVSESKLPPQERSILLWITMYNKFKQYEHRWYKRLQFLLRSFYFRKTTKEWFDFIKNMEREEMHRFMLIPHRSFYDTRLTSEERVFVAKKHFEKNIKNTAIAGIDLKNGKRLLIGITETTNYTEGLKDIKIVYEQEVIYRSEEHTSELQSH